MRDCIEGLVVAVVQLELGPRGRNPRPKAKRVHLSLDPEDDLMQQTVEPCRRTGVPGPSTATGVRGLAVDIRRKHVRFDLVALDRQRVQRVVDGVQ